MSLLLYALQQFIPAGVQPAGRGMVSVLVVEKEVVVRVVVAQYNNQFRALFCRPCLQTIRISFKFAHIFHCKSLDFSMNLILKTLNNVK